MKIGLSDILKNKFDILIQTIINELKQFEFKASMKGNISLDEIIKDLR